jgi:glucosamine 6-phosphate synthetase-like amidotransferase/phosphosugar isomerase protein
VLRQLDSVGFSETSTRLILSAPHNSPLVLSSDSTETSVKSDATTMSTHNRRIQLSFLSKNLIQEVSVKEDTANEPSIEERQATDEKKRRENFALSIQLATKACS